MPTPESLHGSHIPVERQGEPTNVNELLLTCSAATAGALSAISNLEHGHPVGVSIAGVIGVLAGRHLYHLLRGGSTKKQVPQVIQ